MPCVESYEVKLVVFDFDNTLSKAHVFKSIAGWDDDTDTRTGKVLVPTPFASTERGQLRRIRELDRVPPFKMDGFARTVFGGVSRIEGLRSTLEFLKEHGGELFVCTKGLVGAVRRCLQDVGLLKYFADVYGNIGCDTYGETPYDRAIARSAITSEESELLGRGYQATWSTKDQLIAQLMRKRHLKREQVIFVDDDAEEIRRAAPVCRTIWVREAEGLTPEHLATLQCMMFSASDWRRKPPTGLGAGKRHRANASAGTPQRGPSPRPAPSQSPTAAKRPPSGLLASPLAAKVMGGSPTVAPTKSPLTSPRGSMVCARATSTPVRTNRHITTPPSARAARRAPRKRPDAANHAAGQAPLRRVSLF